MGVKSLTCPNCGASFKSTDYRCEYCGSYVFVSGKNYEDISNIHINLQNKSGGDTGKNPGIYVFGRLLGKGEIPITIGAANYYTGTTTAGGKLLLTNKCLYFSAHAFNVGRQEAAIPLSGINNARVSANFLISQQILVTANGEEHKFVVYHGDEWVVKIIDAVNKCGESDTPAPKQNDYINELQQLKQLLDTGVITEDEFNMKKRILLGL